MAKIHGLVYILVGLFVSVMSYKLNYEKLLFFFYFGLLFVFVGVAKLIFNLIKNKSKKPQHKMQHQTQHIKYCHNCGAALRLNHRFCARCGSRV